MVAHSSAERLQPALLDRLRDEERVVPVLELSVTASRLEELGVALAGLIELLAGQGCRPFEASPLEAEGTRRLLFSAPPTDVTLARLRSLPVPTTRGGMVPLSDCARLELRTVRNPAVEAPEYRLLSMRRLREAVIRDLVWLLNTTNLETDEDLSLYPHVRRSVLNFGMPSIAGRTATSVDPQQAARRISDAIGVFEPRLRRVSVTPELTAERMDQRALSFKIDAELWGQPTPQRLLLHTQLDVDSGNLSIREANG